MTPTTSLKKCSAYQRKNWKLEKRLCMKPWSVENLLPFICLTRYTKRYLGFLGLKCRRLCVNATFIYVRKEAGLPRIEAATCGALLVVPEGLYRPRSMDSLEHVRWRTKQELINALAVKTNPVKIRKRALEHSWDKVVKRMLPYFRGWTCFSANLWKSWRLEPTQMT